MRLSISCMSCIVRSQEKKLNGVTANEEVKERYFKEMLKAIGESEDACSAPVMVARLGKVQEKYFGKPMDYTEVKRKFNKLMLELMPQVENRIQASPDPLAAAVLYARAGNYIDFAALDHVEEEMLLEILDKAREDSLDMETYKDFREDLKQAKQLVYLTDNCGEIVMDRLLVEQLKRQFPGLNVTVIVRGFPVVNDATMEDAAEVGLTEETKVLGNGTDIAGTDLSAIDDASRKALEDADLIISKGQGNFETLNGCGKNIYYLFLCKCQRFTRQFGMEMLKGVFVRER